MRIKEIMTPTVISIRSDQSLLEVREPVSYTHLTLPTKA